METVEIPKAVWSPISGLVQHGIYKNEKSALLNIVHDLSLSKMKESQYTMQVFEKKYGISHLNGCSQKYKYSQKSASIFRK